VDPAESSAGEPPRDKWPQILTNARAKALESYGIPAHLPPDQLRQHIALLTQDPRAYYEALGYSLRQNGVLRDEPPPAPRPPAPPPAQTSVPEADLVTADGTGVYSKDGMLAAARHLVGEALAQFRAEQDQLMSPLVSTAEKIQVAEIRAHSHEVARDLFDEVKAWPHFETLRSRMTDLVRAQPLSRDIRAQVEAAYNQALREHLPNYEASIRASSRQDALGQITNTAKRARQASTPAPGATVGLAANGSIPGQSLDARISRAIESAFNGAVPR
jgi:hypothetical protein